MLMVMALLATPTSSLLSSTPRRPARSGFWKMHLKAGWGHERWEDGVVGRVGGRMAGCRGEHARRVPGGLAVHLRAACAWFPILSSEHENPQMGLGAHGAGGGKSATAHNPVQVCSRG